MKVERISASGNSCNFCSRGELSASKQSIIRPYTEVTAIQKDDGYSGVVVNVCDKCLTELFVKVEFVKL